MKLADHATYNTVQQRTKAGGISVRPHIVAQSTLAELPNSLFRRHVEVCLGTIEAIASIKHATWQHTIWGTTCSRYALRRAIAGKLPFRRSRYWQIVIVIA